MRVLDKRSPQVTRFSNGVQEWSGDTAKEGRFIVPFQPIYPRPGPKSPSTIAPKGLGPGFDARQEVGAKIEILDVERVKTVLEMLRQEQDIADAMAGKPPRQRKKNAKTGAGGASNSVASPAGRKEHRTDRSLGDCEGGNLRFPNEQHANDIPMSAGTLSGKKSRTRGVLAVYKHRGAQLVLAQTRKRHPFKQEGVFCRADRGEWAGQVIATSIVNFGENSAINNFVKLDPMEDTLDQLFFHCGSRRQCTR